MKISFRLFLPTGGPVLGDRRPGNTFSQRKAVSAVVLLFVMTAIASSAQSFTTLVNFNGTNGAGPGYMSLVQGFDGNLYGTTPGGGTNGSGTFFKVTSSGQLTSLYSFCAQASCADGGGPSAALVQDIEGNFHGTTTGGGANSNNGTVFKITPQGALTTLYSFCSQANCTDGAKPDAPLVQADDGNLYGTTTSGGTNGWGSIFKVTPQGGVTTLYSFCSQANCTDGASPPLGAGLIQGFDGYLYGVTGGGGATGHGVIFRISIQGQFATLYSFCKQSGCSADGSGPVGLIQVSNGSLYGTSASGGQHGYGTVFQFSKRVLTTLYNFCSKSNCADGGQPFSGLIRATNGNFYGTTYTDGPGKGTVFKITPTGALSTLHSFCRQTGCPDGDHPSAELFQATDGNFYGTTYLGGSNNLGTIFRLSLGLRPFVETVPNSGAVGASVVILGTNLTGATVVSFNSTVATYTVVSSTEITATVPTGATTGKVTVATPGGTLTSNIAFRVVP
jgi:uncharacterized repeat protein (TIGR03803 family)